MSDQPALRNLSRPERVRLFLRGFEYRRMPGWFRKFATVHLPDPFERSVQLENGRDLVFIHVPKTGGTSQASALGLQHGHVPVSRYIAHDESRFRAAASFAFVRNPWTRLFSSFNYLKSAIGINASPDVRWAEANLARYAEFEEFVLDLRHRHTRERIFAWAHFRPQLAWLALPGATQVEVDFIGKFETLDQDTQRLSEFLDVPIELPHLRQARHYRSQPEFTERMISIVADCYGEDIAAFDYEPPVG